MAYINVPARTIIGVDDGESSAFRVVTTPIHLTVNAACAADGSYEWESMGLVYTAAGGTVNPVPAGCMPCIEKSPDGTWCRWNLGCHNG